MARRLTGVVLAGGESSRMGRDKGLLRAGGITFAEICLQKVEACTDEVLLSLRENQVEPYSGNLPDPRKKLFVPDINLPCGGPLRGILSVFLHLRESRRDADAILVLPVDMPFVEARTLRRLETAFRADPFPPGIFYENNGQLEPLGGIYSFSLMDLFWRSLEQGSDSSLYRRLLTLPVERLKMSDEETAGFRNLNAPRDFESESL